MIQTKKQLRDCLKADAALYPKLNGCWLNKIKNRLVTNPINTQYHIWKYVMILRLSEYYFNNSLFSRPLTHTNKLDFNRILNTLFVLWHFYRLRKLSYKLGIQIPPNTCGPGLQIWHYGYIIINGAARVGKNLTIYPGVEIGHKVAGAGCPEIGNNVFIGAGVKIFGNIKNWRQRYYSRKCGCFGRYSRQCRSCWCTCENYKI